MYPGIIVWSGLSALHCTAGPTELVFEKLVLVFIVSYNLWGAISEYWLVSDGLWRR